jgi:hypothetical protein
MPVAITSTTNHTIQFSMCLRAVNHIPAKLIVVVALSQLTDENDGSSGRADRDRR